MLKVRPCLDLCPPHPRTRRSENILTVPGALQGMLSACVLHTLGRTLANAVMQCLGNSLDGAAITLTNNHIARSHHLFCLGLGLRVWSAPLDYPQAFRSLCSWWRSWTVRKLWRGLAALGISSTSQFGGSNRCSRLSHVVQLQLKTYDLREFI